MTLADCKGQAVYYRDCIVKDEMHGPAPVYYDTECNTISRLKWHRLMQWALEFEQSRIRQAELLVGIRDFSEESECQ